MVNSSDFMSCEIEDLKFEALNAKDQEALNAYTKMSAAHIAVVVISAVIAAALLIWAWLLSHNGIGFSIAVSVLSLIVFGAGWSIGGKKNNKAQGAVHGVIETSFYRSAQNGSSCDAVDYFATVAFPSSEQRVVNMKIPAVYALKGGLAKEGAEIIIFKMSDNTCAVVYPEHPADQERYTYKLPRA